MTRVLLLLTLAGLLAAQPRLNETRLAEARDFAVRGGGAGVVMHYGKIVYQWGDTKARFDLKSSSKSIGVTALGLAIMDRKVALHDSVLKHCPDIGSKDITFFHLASQTAGFDKPGGFQPLLFKPGEKWSYSDAGPNYLADCLTTLYNRDLEDLLFERVFTPLGITHDDLKWRPNAYRPKELNGVARREFGSGVHANVEAMARIGLLYALAGRIKTRQVLPPDFVAMLRQPLDELRGLEVLKEDEHPKASSHYGLLWWNNGDGHVRGVPTDAYWSWGLYDSHILIIPSLDLIVARAGPKSIYEKDGKLEPFLRPLAEAVPPVRPPYPPSSVIAGIEWASPKAVHRDGSDCDNLPTAWADDGELYTAFGDCRGFLPLRPEKLGMGFARIDGPPETAKGVNIPSDTGENKGQGANGRKASGMIAIDGVLYVFTRNAGNSQLGWSTDHAKTWTWADWKLNPSFGHPAFLSFGKNYADARDQYVYIYSPDHDSAYENATALVMARVPKNRIRERAAYEFFRALDNRGRPAWTKDITQRGPVFTNPAGGVYRTQVSYNPGLKRYIMNQIWNGSEFVRFQGGLGIYDAPEPWGPWTTAYFNPTWDIGPGENQHFPPKWMSADGKTMYLIFSGDDRFSTRRVTVRLK